MHPAYLKSTQFFNSLDEIQLWHPSAPDGLDLSFNYVVDFVAKYCEEYFSRALNAAT